MTNYRYDDNPYEKECNGNCSEECEHFYPTCIPIKQAQAYKKGFLAGEKSREFSEEEKCVFRRMYNNIIDLGWFTNHFDVIHSLQKKVLGDE